MLAGGGSAYKPGTKFVCLSSIEIVKIEFLVITVSSNMFDCAWYLPLGSWLISAWGDPTWVPGLND
jgi:hypothetical protein